MAVAITTLPDTTHESQSLFTMAVERINRKNYSKALDLLIEALRIAPGHPVYLSYFGLCLGHVDTNFERSMMHCRQAVDSLPTEPLLYVNLAKVHRMMGENSRAYDILRNAWKIDSKHPVVAAELTRMGIRRQPFLTFLPRNHWCNRHLGRLRAELERRLIGHRQS